jgi:hypothetical protein
MPATKWEVTKHSFPGLDSVILLERKWQLSYIDAKYISALLNSGIETIWAL